MDTSWLATLFLGFVVLYLLYLLANMNGNYWKTLGVPFAEDPSPFFGNSADLMLRKQSFPELMREMYEKFDNEQYFGFLLNRTPIFVPRSPELINNMLIKNFNNFHDRRFPKKGSDLVSDSLINVTGDPWRNLRQKLTPTFTSGKLKIMFKNIKECSDEIVSYMKAKKGEDIEIKELSFKFVINVIGSVAFGLKINALNEGEEITKKFLHAINCFATPSYVTLLKNVLSMSYPKLANYFEVMLIDKDVNTFFHEFVKDMIKKREESTVHRTDFLQLMLDQRGKINENKVHDHYEVDEPEDSELLTQLNNMKPVTDKSSNSEIFTDACIASQSFTFISGGSETTSTTLSFAMYEIASDKLIQEKLHNEIDDVIKTHGFDYQSIKKMTYTDQVINEVMRKYPSLGALSRICTEDFKIPGTDITIKKDTIIMIPVMGLHRDTQYYRNPEKFDPDRFQNIESIPKGAYLPFGAGPRMCIALRLAMLQMKILLVNVLSNFNLTLSSKTSVPLKMNKNAVVLKPDGGVWVKFEERNTTL